MTWFLLGILLTLSFGLAAGMAVWWKFYRK